MNAYGYFVDLRGLSLTEGSATWIQAMPLGTYDHPMYGKIQFTHERILRFAQSVKDRVRTTDLDIDYDHKQYNGEAAGWVRDAEARTDGLWLLVEWTKTAYTKIKEGAYKYFSPEFYDEWQHPKTKVKHKDVLFGGGITNRPHIRDILPINLSEFWKIEPITEMEQDTVSWPPQLTPLEGRGSNGPEGASATSWPPGVRY